MSFPKELPPSRSLPRDQLRIRFIQPNVLLLDCKIKGVPVSAVVDCGSPNCILSNDVFNCFGLDDTLGRVGSKDVGAERFTTEHPSNRGARPLRE